MKQKKIITADTVLKPEDYDDWENFFVVGREAKLAVDYNKKAALWGRMRLISDTGKESVVEMSKDMVDLLVYILNVDILAVSKNMKDNYGTCIHCGLPYVKAKAVQFDIRDIREFWETTHLRELFDAYYDSLNLPRSKTSGRIERITCVLSIEKWNDVVFDSHVNVPFDLPVQVLPFIESAFAFLYSPSGEEIVSYLPWKKAYDAACSLTDGMREHKYPSKPLKFEKAYNSYVAKHPELFTRRG